MKRPIADWMRITPDQMADKWYEIRETVAEYWTGSTDAKMDEITRMFFETWF